MSHQSKIDFAAINEAASSRLFELIRDILPEGRLQGREWIALNPTRPDRREGSFKVNTVTGRWSDFAIGDAGGDIISLVAYVRGISQRDAAKRVAGFVGVSE